MLAKTPASHVALIVEVSATRAYSRVALANINTLTGLVVRTLWGLEVCPTIFWFESGLSRKANKCSEAGTGVLGVLPTHES